LRRGAGGRMALRLPRERAGRALRGRLGQHICSCFVLFSVHMRPSQGPWPHPGPGRPCGRFATGGAEPCAHGRP
jgi:hypothetical protein